MLYDGVIVVPMHWRRSAENLLIHVSVQVLRNASMSRTLFFQAIVFRSLFFPNHYQLVMLFSPVSH